jgi:mannosyltransferase
MIGISATRATGLRALGGQLSWHRKRCLNAVVLFAIFMAGLGLRLYELGAESLWTDELNTFATSQLDPWSIVQAQVGLGWHPPLHYLVTHVFLRCFGQSDFAARLQAALFGSLTVMLVYKAGKTLWGEREGVIGALLLTVNAYHIGYSQEARNYALMTFLALLSLVFFLKALHRKRRSLWLAFALCTSLSLYNHYFAFLFLPSLVVAGAWVGAEDLLSAREEHPWQSASDSFRVLCGSTGSLGGLIASLVFVLASYVPWLPILLAQFGKNGQPQSGAVGAPSFLGSCVAFVRTALAAYTGGPSVALFLSAGLFLLGVAACGRKQITLVGLWIGLPFAFLALPGLPHFVHPRYVLFILPLFLLVVARGVTKMAHLLWGGPGARQRADRGWCAVVASSLTVLAIAACNVPALAAHYAVSEPNWRAVAQYLAAEMPSGGIVLADGEGYGGVRDGVRVATRLPFYLSRHGLPDLPVLSVQLGLSQALADRQWSGNGEVWSVVLHPRSALAIGQGTEQISVEGFDKISVVRLREPSENALQSAVIMLQALCRLLPASEAHFELHLALAEVYYRTGRFEQAKLELDMASGVRPDEHRALGDLSRARDELQRLSGASACDVRYTLWRNLGLKVALVGYDLHPTAAGPGDTLHLTLYWLSYDRVDRPYTVFTHLLGEADQIWAQQDNQPQGGDRPTSSWLPGEMVRDEYELVVSMDAPAGQYTVEIGMYDGATGERLPVWDDDGRRLEQDRILLRSVVIAG